LVSGFTPSSGQQFVLFTYAAGSSFDFAANNFPPGFTISSTPTQLIVTAP
jgi:hypothetical protein